MNVSKLMTYTLNMYNFLRSYTSVKLNKTMEGQAECYISQVQATSKELLAASPSDTCVQTSFTLLSLHQFLWRFCPDLHSRSCHIRYFCYQSTWCNFPAQVGSSSFGLLRETNVIGCQCEVIYVISYV